jgi:hypothetical protein
VAAAQKKVCEVVEDDVRRTQPLVAYLVGRMCLAWSVSLGLAHHSKAEHMHALVFGHVDSLVRKRRCLVVCMSIDHVMQVCQNKY